MKYVPLVMNESIEFNWSSNMADTKEEKTLLTQQYKEVCEPQFKRILKGIAEINHRLFLDNGNECLQSKVNRHNVWLRILTGICSTVGIAIVGLLIWIAKVLLTTHLAVPIK